MSALDKRIDKWKNRLLDLGKRNRLINYKETKRSNIKIISPDLEELYTKIVINEQALEFPFPRNDEDEDTEDNNVESIIISNGDIQTSQSIKEQQKTLRNLRNKAKTAIEEQGVNVLYLSFGFLKWKESNDSDTYITSPIVLVPVSLILESITSPFVLRLHEDEIVTNPTLKYKMEHDFGIEVPDYDSNEDDITKYLQGFNRLVSKNKWEVVNDIGLSLLSFLKINMYEDLDENQDILKAHPVLKALNGEVDQIKVLSEEYNQYDHDNKTRAIDTYQVVDADSSQQDAILYAKKGVSFVLQGPPGTGKSQTITNIIAECLSEGKKVLFVSEKMAALDVVHKRLSQSGLDDFCLTLHSHKANKKEVLQDLGKTLTTNKIKLQEEAILQLETLQLQRDKLNKYVIELHTPVKPLNQSLYSIFGRIAKLSEYPDVIFSLENVRETTPDKLNKYTFSLEEFTKTIGKMSEDYTHNPWRNCNVINVSHELRHDIESKLKKLSVDLGVLCGTYDQIDNKLNLNRKSSITAVEDLVEIIEVSKKSPCVPLQWVISEDINDLVVQAEKFKALKKEHGEIFNSLSENYTEDYLKLQANHIEEQLTLSINKVASTINHDTYPKEEDIVTYVKLVISELVTLQEQLTVANKSGKHITELLSITDKTTIVKLEALRHIVGIMLLKPKPTENWFDENKFEIVKKLTQDAKEKHNKISDYISTITNQYDDDIFSIDYDSILKRFKSEYTSWLKVFKSSYRKDKKMIRSLAKDLPKRIEDHEIVSLLTKIKDSDKEKAWFKENEDLLNKMIGSNYNGDYTNWDLIEESINQFTTIMKYFSDEQLSSSVKNLLLDEGDNYYSVKEQYDILKIINFDSLKSVYETNISITGKPEDISISEIQTVIKETVTYLKLIDGYYTEMKHFCKKELSYNEDMNNLSKLTRLQSIDGSFKVQSDKLQEHYKTLFNGINTNWDDILESLAWTSQFKKLNEKYNLPHIYIEKICSDASFVTSLDKYHEEIKIDFNKISDDWNWYTKLFDDMNEHKQIFIPDLISRINNCKDNIYLLEEWIDFRNCRLDCRNIGLSDYIGKIEEKKIKRELIVGTFFKRFYRLWVDSVLPDFPSVQSFRSRSHGDTINEFKKLDITQFKISQSRIKEQLVSKLPDMNAITLARDEVGILKRELSKQRKIMPLRKLFKAIPNLFLRLKPCLMMSPLSVSLFLDANDYNFDIVIFDEASQVRTEDAIGAVMRGAQVIIAGDSKQLPPTSFFAANTSEGDYDNVSDDEEELEDTDAFESILDESITVLPERTLRWHYRSRHEHLIAFSNAKIYNHNLITFPSYIEKLPNHGVEYIYVENGIYDRGGKKSNSQEAIRVTELVFEHFRKNPHRSLGVVTFSEAQQQAVETVIRQYRLKNQEFERFFNEDKDEAFFIKNLENVQGDERDTIIFSIGYAKDSNGVMYMNFGPLSRNGGYRRLNVAITRAKYNVKLVGSILPTDIRLESTNAEGVKMLRSYIEFAMNGPDVLQRDLTYSDTVEVDSPFEEAVYDFLVKNEYKVTTQVGCSGYRIDLAVKHPTLSGRFVLGVECDGAAYHSARTARERDRLRQMVLEDIGWKIHRIWSTDWIKDPLNEGRKLLEAVEKSIAEYTDEANSVTIDSRHLDLMQHEFDYVVEIQNIPNENKAEESPLRFDYYEEVDVYEIDWKSGRYSNKLSNIIEYIVKKEHPIHFELLCKRIAGLFGNQKVTSRVRDSAKYAIKNNLSQSVEWKDDFLWEKGVDTVSVRVPQSNDVGMRHITHICKEEIAEAMLIIVQNSFGITTQELYTSTARVFGFNRMGANISVAMQVACDYLVEKEKVKNNNDKVVV
jgi:very-short-patch-repair endonuclease